MAKTKSKSSASNERRHVFTSKNVLEIIDKQNDGIAIPRYMNPWFKNDIGVRKAGVVYGWTKHELEEYAKCAIDIHYFANNYCKIKSEDGQIKQMRLRDYQYDVLSAYTKNRFTLNMSSRQTGKCIELISIVKTKINGVIKELPAFKVLFMFKKNKSIYDYLKYPFYWMLYKLN